MLESAAAWLVDHILPVEWVQFVDDIVAFFSADQEASHGSFVADSEAGGIVSAAVELAG